jgi:hypothetical protein
VETRVRWIFGITLACLAAALLLPAIPQPLDYHAFADDRTFFGIPNFLDVVSNAAFVVAGAVGLVATFGSRTRFETRRERWPYAVLFLGVLLTGFGSAYYHLAPDNERLFWDRLPMAVAFMGLVASQLADRIGVRTGLWLLAPLLVLGVASVVYWRATERIGAGNIVPYAVLQAYAVFVLLLIASFTRSRYTLGHLLYWVFGWYVLSKVLEALDHEIFAIGGVVSGHTLKHLAAAAAAFVVWRMLVRRDVSAEAGRGSAPLPSAGSVIG